LFCSISFASDIRIIELPANPKEASYIIQREIDKCSFAGGGILTLPAGRFVCGTIVIKSGVTLNFPKSCVMVGDTNPDLFPLQKPANVWYSGREGHHHRALIYAENAENVGLIGEGLIVGQGDVVYKNWAAGNHAFRWMLVLFTNCQNVKVKGVSMKNSPSWMQLYQGCKNLTISKIQIENFGAKNCDGLDLDACQNVKIINCQIDSDDDALVLKSLSHSKMENILIKNCRLSSNCNAFKTGTESQGMMSNIRAKNISISPASIKSKIYLRQFGLAGIALTMVDGGKLENVRLENFTIKGCKVPIFVRQGIRNRTHAGIDSSLKSSVIRNIHFRKFDIKMESDIPNHITAVDSGHISDLKFERIVIDYQLVDSLCIGHIRTKFEENPKTYPEATTFKNSLPKSIWFLRNIQNVTFSSITIKDAVKSVKANSRFVLDKCSGILF